MRQLILVYTGIIISLLSSLTLGGLAAYLYCFTDTNKNGEGLVLGCVIMAIVTFVLGFISGDVEETHKWKQRN